MYIKRKERSSYNSNHSRSPGSYKDEVREKTRIFPAQQFYIMAGLRPGVATAPPPPKKKPQTTTLSLGRGRKAGQAASKRWRERGGGLAPQRWQEGRRRAGGLGSGRGGGGKRKRDR